MQRHVWSRIGLQFIKPYKESNLHARHIRSRNLHFKRKSTIMKQLFSTQNEKAFPVFWLYTEITPPSLLKKFYYKVVSDFIACDCPWKRSKPNHRVWTKVFFISERPFRSCYNIHKFVCKSHILEVHSIRTIKTISCEILKGKNKLILVLKVLISGTKRQKHI